MSKTTKELAIELTNWLLDPKDVELKDYLLVPELKYRLFDYCLRNPSLVHYIDSHLNCLYDFDKYTTKEWFLTFKEIFRKYKIQYKKQLYFVQFKPPKRNNFKKEIREYFTANNLSENDLNSLYYLYENHLISDQLLNYIKTLSSGKDNTHKQLDILPSNVPQKDTPPTKSLNEPLLAFNAFISQYINSRIPCQNCALFSKERQPVFTNVTLDSPKIDVMIITEQPFDVNNTSDPTQVLLALVKKLNLTFIFTSLVLCKPDNNIIPNAKNTIKNCEGVRKYVYQHFTSKVKVLVGSKVKSAFGFKGAMNQLNGTYESGVVFLTEPNTSVQISAFKKGLVKVNDVLTNISETKHKKIKKTKDEFNYDDLKNHTLFDVKIVGEKIIYIFIENETGKKKFISEEISYPIYIKQGDFRRCAHIESEVDLVTYVTNQQRNHLLNALRINMFNVIENCSR